MALLNCILAALVSGLTLFAGETFSGGCVLQLVAFIPFLLVLWKWPQRWYGALLGGFILGFCYSTLYMFWLRFPLNDGALFALYLSAGWMLFGLGALKIRELQRLGPLAQAFGVGALGVCTEWLNITLLPMWGSAQTFVRSWAEIPQAVQFIALTGLSGVVFFVLALQALGVLAILNQVQRRRITLTVLVVLLLLAVVNTAYWYRSSEGKITLAALGWHYRQIQFPRQDQHLPEGARQPDKQEFLFQYIVEPHIREAASKGAKLVVLPEIGFSLDAEQREPWFQRWKELAQELQIMLVIGFMDEAKDENRAGFFDAGGALRGLYTKTHLVMFYESNVAGKGELVLLPLPAGAGHTFTLGGMICQDDNFTDLSRAYANAGAQLIAVPTNDWTAVRQVHWQSSILRAIESGYAVARAAENGVSGIISARGAVLARFDHIQRADGLALAETPIYLRQRWTHLYACLGEWFPLVSAVGLIGLIWYGNRRPRE